MEQGFQVDGWQVQPDLGTLTCGEEQLQLEPKVMDVLVYLARHAGELLPKEKILRAVWAEAFVTDEVLTNAISELRKAFGDDAKEPTFIQTLPRRGYRLIAPVSRAEESREGNGSAHPQTAPEPPPRPFWRHPSVFVGSGLLVILAGLLIWQLLPEPPVEGPIDSIAILPFRNDTGVPEADYLCTEIPASLSAKLSELRELRVIPTSNLSRFREQEVEAVSAATQLGVRAVFQGWVLQVGEELSIRVELSDGRENRVLWGESYHCPFSDVFAIEEEIVGQVTAGLRFQLGREQEARLSLRPTENLDAYEAYLRGRFLSEDDRTVEGQSRAITYFEQAISKDPDYVQAHIGLGDAYSLIGYYSTSATAYQYAREAYETAFRLQPDSAETNAAMATVHAWYDRDWNAADEKYRRALQLEPGFADWHYLVWRGRREEALQQIRRDAERSDPLSAGQQSVVGWYFYLAGDYAQAIHHAAESIRLGAVTGYPPLLLSLRALDREEEASETVLDGMTAEWFDDEHYFGGTPVEVELEEIRQGIAKSGMAGFYRVLARRERLVKPYDRAGAWAVAGDADKAFYWLEKAFELPYQPPFVTDARFDSLRDDPRFEQLLRKLSLPQEVIAIHLKAGR